MHRMVFPFIANINMSRPFACCVALAVAFSLIGPLPLALAAVTADVTGNVDPTDPSTWTSSTKGYIGKTSDGTLTITSGTLLSSYGYLGYNSGVAGVVNVSNSGLQWTNSYNLFVGNSGSGTLNIANGGVVSNSTGYLGFNSGSTGTASVDGANSKWTNSWGISVGESGSGTLKITNGGTVANEWYNYIGNKSGSTGTVSVDGANSNWTNSGGLLVGNSGNGTLNISNGGVVSSSAGHLGYNSGSTGTVTVDGANSQWTNSWGISVGESGSGTLIITNGGTVAGKWFDYIGNKSGSAGMVSVDGTNSQWTSSSSLTVGNSGSGTLNIANGGAVSNTTGDIGYNLGSTGTVSVDGTNSKWTNSGSLTVGNSGSGTLNIANGGSVSVGGSTYVAKGVTGTGTINFGPNGGTLTTQSLGASSSQLTGVGMINARGLVSDVDLVFDATHGLSQSFAIQNSEAGQNITVNLDVSSNAGDLGAGYSGNGSLTIKDAKVVSSQAGWLGYKAGSTGSATITGTGSKWTISSNLYVGDSGHGTLNITNGGSVTVSGTTHVAQGATGSGNINFNNGTLNTRSLFIAPSSQMSGTGTINAQGIVSDTNLVFDKTHGLIQTLAFSNTAQSITLNLNMRNNYAVGDLGVGYLGSGSLAIRDGLTVTSAHGYIGYKAGSEGTATVSGFGSKWATNSGFVVGNNGKGTLSVSDGGAIGCNDSSYSGVTPSSTSWIGYNQGSTGVVNISGESSTWSGINGLYIGHSGSGTLNIENGGAVTATANSSSYSNEYFIGYNAGATGVVSVSGNNSTWTTGDLSVGYSGSGTLNIANGGKVSSFTSDSYSIDSNVSIGLKAGSIGIANVSGDNSTWATGSLTVGDSGDGTLSITNGGVVSSNVNYRNSSYANMYAIVGRNGGSKGAVNVSGEGSSWTTNQGITIGTSGTLAVTDGGYVASFTNGTGSSSSEGGGVISSTGSIIVSGSGSKLIAGSTLTVSGATSYVNGVNVGPEGTLAISDGGAVTDSIGVIGGSNGAKGAVTVDNATWINTSSLYVGNYVGNSSNYGIGTLNIINGGKVQNNNGYISAPPSSYQSQNIASVVNVDNATWVNNGSLTVGGTGIGILNIVNGGNVTSVNSTICTSSYYSSSNLVSSVTVDHATWTDSGNIYVGNSAPGMLKVVNGGVVNCVNGSIGGGYTYYGTSSAASVSGTNSKWINSGSLSVGSSSSGIGVLSITSGGAVTAASVAVYGSGLLALDVGYGSSLTVGGGTGTITNYGIVRMSAGTAVKSGVYKPISAGTLSSGGVWQALGGKWDATLHTFTVSDAVTGTAGSPVTIDLASQQRILVTDSATGESVGASFLGSITSQSVTFTATAMSDSTLAGLKALKNADDTILSSWSLDAGIFSTPYPYPSSAPVYLSLFVGAGQSVEDLTIWSFNSDYYTPLGYWTKVSPSDLTYDGAYANFTVTWSHRPGMFSGYAVTSPVPEPGAITLLAAAFAVLAVYARRKRG